MGSPYQGYEEVNSSLRDVKKMFFPNEIKDVKGSKFGRFAAGVSARLESFKYESDSPRKGFNSPPKDFSGGVSKISETVQSKGRKLQGPAEPLVPNSSEPFGIIEGNSGFPNPKNYRKQNLINVSKKMNKSEQISNTESPNAGNSDDNIPMDSIGRKSSQIPNWHSPKDQNIFNHTIVVDRCSPRSHHSARSQISHISKIPHP